MNGWVWLSGWSENYPGERVDIGQKRYVRNQYGEVQFGRLTGAIAVWYDTRCYRIPGHPGEVAARN